MTITLVQNSSEEVQPVQNFETPAHQQHREKEQKTNYDMYIK